MAMGCGQSGDGLCALRRARSSRFARLPGDASREVGAAVFDRGRDVLNPRALGMVCGHRSWAAMVSRRIMRMEMDHALCICVTVVSPSYAVCGVCLCVCQMKVKKGGTESEGRQSNHHLSHGQARSSTGSDLAQRPLHSFDGRARAGAAEYTNCSFMHA